MKENLPQLIVAVESITILENTGHLTHFFFESWHSFFFWQLVWRWFKIFAQTIRWVEKDSNFSFFLAACVALVDEYFVWEGDSENSWQRLYVCNYSARSFIAVWDAVRFLETLIFTVSLYKLWKVVDAFTIRMELVGVCSIWIVNLSLRVALGIYSPK